MMGKKGLNYIVRSAVDSSHHWELRLSWWESGLKFSQRGGAVVRMVRIRIEGRTANEGPVRIQ